MQKMYPHFLCHRKLRQCIVKNAGFAFFLGAIVVFPGEVFTSLERLVTIHGRFLKKAEIVVLAHKILAFFRN